MLTLQQAKTKPLVKSTGKYGTIVFKKGRIENGKYNVGSQLSNIVAGDLVGVITEVYTMPNGNHLAVVMLSKPIFSFFTKYTHGIIQLVDVDLIVMSEIGRKYYSLGNRVNIRKSASLSAPKYELQLMKNDPIGTSDGIANREGWLKFSLAMGGIGYVKKEFATVQEPEKIIIIKEVVNTNPQTGVETLVKIPLIEVPPGTTDYPKIAKTAIISTVIGYVITRLIEHFFTK